MKSYKFLTYLVFLLLLLSATSTAYTPQDEGFVEALIFSTPEDRTNIFVGDLVEMTIIVKNLTNDTISNITLTQELPVDNAELIQLGDEVISETTSNFTDFSFTDPVTNQQLTFSYLNFSDSMIMANLQLDIAENEQFAFNFVMNFTLSGQFPFVGTEVVYYDHWPDRQVASVTQGTTVEVSDREEVPNRQYIPVFESEAPDYTLIFGVFFGLILVALLSRIAYGKLPPVVL